MIPNRADRAAFIVAMIKNAQDLLSDASLLLTSGRDARAFVLSVLAREEAGKALLALAQDMGDPEIHRRHLTSHREKLLSAGAAPLFLVGDPDRVSEGAQDLKNDKTHEETMAGLYVDWQDGKLRTLTALAPRELPRLLPARPNFWIVSNPSWGASLRRHSKLPNY